MNKYFFILKILFIAFFIGITAGNLPAAAQEKLTGHWIAQQVFDRDRGKNSISSATMVLVNKNGR